MDVEDCVMSIKGFKFSLETPLKIKIIRKNQLEADLIDAKARWMLEKKVGHAQAGRKEIML